MISSRLNGRLTETTAPQLLVDDTYDGSEARELVTALLDSTRNAHNLRNLRAQMQQQQPEPSVAPSRERLAALRDELQQALARADGRRVRVRTTIDVEILDEPYFD